MAHDPSPNEAFAAWVDQGVAFAESLPARLAGPADRG
jgi:hypothetical protein